MGGNQPPHILRQGGDEVNLRPGEGVAEPQLIGVEGRPGNEPRLLGTVEPISRQRAAQGGAVEAELVRSSRHRTEQKKA